MEKEVREVGKEPFDEIKKQQIMEAAMRAGQILLANGAEISISMSMCR